MQLANLHGDHEVHQQLRKIPAILVQSVTRDETALALAQRIFKRLYEPDRGLSIEVLLVVLESINVVCMKLIKELTSWIIYSDVDRKLNREITSGFISLGLVNLSEFDPHMAKLMDNGRNQNVLEFNMFRFVLYQADEYSLSYMESDPDSHPMSDINYIAEQLGPVLGEKKAALEAAFAAADAAKTGFVTYDALQDILSENDMELNDQVLITLMRRFDYNKDGNIKYGDLMTLA